MPKIALTPQHAREIVFGDNPDWEIVKEEIVGQRRWVTEHEAILKHNDKFYIARYDKPSTESVDICPYDEDQGCKEAIFVEVRPVEKTVIEYEVVED